MTTGVLLHFVLENIGAIGAPAPCSVRYGQNSGWWW